MRLGDYFSKKEKKSLLLPEGIVLGTVLRAFVDFTNPPKIKRFIVIGFNEDNITLASVLINSELNLNVNYNSELQSHQIPLECEGKEYLLTDSYVDCSEIHNIEKQTIEESLQKDPHTAIGKVEKKELNTIIRTIINSEVVKGKYKRKCGLFDYKFEDE
ncbi:hypothetical protein [Lacinutrix sp. Hel_I_90]|uniref:hypothetical protein n=1 Tax=Lacinutrix sp. Hel_I_90 TaxID=1249999 RepID=UPI000696D6F7|nr:hypothetical protein [Lacinutrix sp. Hel_I_90]